MEETNFVPNRNIPIPRSIREIFADNRKYISREEFDPETIRKQQISSEDLIVYPLGEINCPTGRIVVGDPIAYLKQETKHPVVMEKSIEPGTYPIFLSIYKSKTFGIKYCLAKMQIRKTDAVRYEIARQEQAKLAGCPVDAGTLAILDEKILKEYQAFVAKWYEAHPDGNIYDNYFQAFYEESAKNTPDLQREGGDFIEWTIPETTTKMYFFTSGFGDGFYQAFWGIDQEEKICELILPMADAEDLKKADDDFAQIEKYLPQAPLCLASRMIYQKQQIGYLRRRTPEHGPQDSGWEMYEGTESNDFIQKPGAAVVDNIRSLCHISPQLITILNAPYDTAWVRNETGDYEQIHDEPEASDDKTIAAADDAQANTTAAPDAVTENTAAASAAADTYVPGSENWISDDDPIYKDLDKWHDDDEYDKILAKVEEIPFEKRSNTLWFRKISALNNLKRFDDAKREIQLLSSRCKIPKDQGKLFYMLGYIYDNTNCEFKAIECFRQALELDPDRKDTDELVADSLSYAKKDMARAKEALGEMIASAQQALAEEKDLVSIDKPAIFTYFAVISSSFMGPSFGMHLNLGEAYSACDAATKDRIRKTLEERSGITDLHTLQQHFGTHRNAPTVEDTIQHMKGEKLLPLEKMNARTKTLFDLTELFLEEMKEYLPEAHVAAWDYCDILGLARLMYAADMITQAQLDETYQFVFAECTKLFSSWEEYLRSVVLGAFYHMLINETSYNIREARKFALTGIGLCKHCFLGVQWPGSGQKS